MRSKMTCAVALCVLFRLPFLAFPHLTPSAATILLGATTLKQHDIEAEVSFSGNHHQNHHDHATTLIDSKHDNKTVCSRSMSMYMDGFHFWSESSCMCFLMKSWTISTRAQLYGVMCIVFALSLLLEWTSHWRRKLSSKERSVGRERSTHAEHTILFIYVIQALLGYLLMLVVMSFSVEWMFAIVLGLAVGNVIFSPLTSLTVSATSSLQRRGDEREERFR
jgi:hypothetical protein